MTAPDTPPSTIDALLDRLAAGESLRTICADPAMPDRRTIQRWLRRDDALAAEIAAAREIGFQDRAERAVEAAQGATDAARGRLAFEAERWYLGKLSQAFADKPARIEAEATVKLDADDIFGHFARALERAAAGIAGGAGGTIRVADDGAARPDHP